MPSSLIPEQPLTISPSLAATIGLEEAVMLQVLHERMRFCKADIRDGYKWFAFGQSLLEEAFPFWQAGDVQRVANNLKDKGIILLGDSNYLLSKQLQLALNEKVVAAVERVAAVNEAPAAPGARSQMLPATREPDAPDYYPGKRAAKPDTTHTQAGAQKLAANWQPGSEILKQLKQLGIPQAFVNEKLPDFIAYWQARNEAHFDWNGRLREWVLRQWRKEETVFASRAKTSEISDRWQPSEDAYEVLERVGVTREFIDEAIPEFVLYWREKGEGSSTWNSKFVQHVRRQWARFTHAITNDAEPRALPADWQPSVELFEILQMANIDEPFARSLIPEFVLFWRDSRELHRSWNSKFLQHVKYHWARRHQLPVSTHAKTAEQDFVALHTNKSWREGL